MDQSLKKAIRDGLISSSIISFISYMFGIVEIMEEGFSLINMALSLIGVMWIGIISFTPVFVISLIYFYFKERKKTERLI
ncbi:hypothetical protein LCGC14_0548150 [marine sediment metagenome]|uniref:Uncharacterized protein n=1 Tax=marine sediment metagenome TaxID=412755 RepID=A0A0F9RVH7_9ZZZZ